MLFPLSGAFAQEIKLFGGANWARYSEVPPVPGYWIPEAAPVLFLHDNPGSVFGIGFEFPLLGRVSLDVNGQYFQKGTKIEWTYPGGQIGGVTRSIYAVNVISVPACLKFKLFPRYSPYIMAGTELSYVLSHDETDFGPFPGSIRSDLIGQTKRFDFGLVVGGGAALNYKRWAAFLELRYHTGLVNLSRGDPDYPVVKTRALALVAGIKLGLSK